MVSECHGSIGLRWELVRQLRPQVFDQLAHRLGDGLDVFEIENLPVDALDLSRVDDPAIEDARLIAGFFLGHFDLPIPISNGAPGDAAAINCPYARGDYGRQGFSRNFW